MEIRLSTAVNTAKTAVDQAVDAVVIAPVVAQGQIVIAAGGEGSWACYRGEGGRESG
jgi:hypothetical protein